MKAITLFQPWAQLVALQAKRYETRSWTTHYRGPLAIHSSKTFPASARALCRREPFASALHGNVDLPLGCVVAVCDLAAVFPTSSKDSLLIPDDCDWPESELAFGDFSPGRFAWLLKNLRVLENPVPARGALSLWEWDQGALGLLHLDTQMKKQSINRRQVRQGDILIERVDSLPKELASKPRENGRVVLAHGEVTGHAHEIAQPQHATLHEMSEAVRLLGDSDGAEAMTQAAMIITAPSEVVHQEHATIPLEKGKYVVRRQREYTPEAIRNVAD